MKKHDATRLHYDLRLEWNGVLLSWVLPEGPSCHAGVPREAILVENHRKKYILFEGVHEPTGTIMVWDCESWEPLPKYENVPGALDKGILRFRLYGRKLKGGWTLRRTGIEGGRSLWTLSKDIDDFAETNLRRCILKDLPNSVLTGRSLKQIAEDWRRDKRRNEQQAELFGLLASEPARQQYPPRT